MKLGVAALFLGLALGAEAAPVLRFAPLPMLPEETLRAQFLPMIDYLQRSGGAEIEWVYIPEYHAVLDALQSDRLDVAYLGPLPYVELTKQNAHFQPLVHFREASGSTSYYCALAAFGGDGLSDPAEVVGKRIGLTQPESTCGPFAVAVMLRRAGRSLDGDGNDPSFAGSHSGVAQGIIAGRFDVGGLKLGIAHQYTNLDLRVIDRTGPYPGFALVANTHTVPPELRAKLTQALLHAPDGEVERWGEPVRHGTGPAADADYDGIRADQARLGASTAPMGGGR